MRTFNRTPLTIDTTIKNLNKYSNQLKFNGIKLDNNIFDVDQESFTDTLNVYVNEQNTLVSREPLREVQLSSNVLPVGSVLVDTQTYKNITIYVSKNINNSYNIIAYDGITIKNLGITPTSYKITTFENLIIAFNDLGAKVLNINKYSDGWVDLSSSDYVEIPVTKITTGSSVEEFPKNQFTDAYENDYINVDNIVTALPADNTASITGEILTSNRKDILTNVNKPWILTKYRTIKQADLPNLTDSDEKGIITAAKDKVCIAFDNYVLISYNYGMSFTQVFYPTTSDIRIRSISEDGRAFFFVSTQGVYRLILDDLTNWTQISCKIWNSSSNVVTYSAIKSPVSIGTGTSMLSRHNYCFLNADTFGFAYSTVVNYLGNGTGTIYFKGSGMYKDNAALNNELQFVDINTTINDKIDSNLIKYGLKMFTSNDTPSKLVCITSQYNREDEPYFVVIQGRANNTILTHRDYLNNYILGDDEGMINRYFTINSIEAITSIGASEGGIGVKIIGVYNRQMSPGPYIAYTQYSLECMYYGQLAGQDYYITNFTNIKTIGPTNTNYFSRQEDFVPILLKDNVYITNKQYSTHREMTIIDATTNTYYNLPTINDINTVPDIRVSNGEGIYYLINKNNNTMFTNYVADTKVIYKYKYTTTTAFTKVPDIIYSGEQLFLTDNNKLQITDILKDNDNIYLNLTDINNQSFANDITGIINISTTETALFLQDNIYICTKVEDENLPNGFRYDYAKTRLSLGTKHPRSIINTLDGAYTIYATPRGLAIMSYQAYMATTDQTLEFVTDSIIELWNAFYAQSDFIACTQIDDYIFVYNQTNKYFMLDLRNMSWWRFEIPYNLKEIKSDQVNTTIISNKLYTFDNSDNRYFDANGERINWKLESQRLHFNLPNHYKNVKQLIFQLVESNTNKSTIKAQIKIYRKNVDYRPPEIVAFDIQEFRTFVKRFNYWKINELQWAIANDEETAIPSRLVLNGIGIKYEIGEEVR